MIELNLTYEESKKILDLGYDFSKVCREFELHRYGMFLRKIKLTNDCFALLDNEDSEEFRAELDYTSLESVLVDGFTPLIPKDALEKCLPSTLDILDYLGNLDLSSFAKRFTCEVIDLHSIMQKGVTHEWFTTAYEAFIWCHEHYPEELKKKFDEVMG
jgi:hypothetical protein